MNGKKKQIPTAKTAVGMTCGRLRAPRSDRSAGYIEDAAVKGQRPEMPVGVGLGLEPSVTVFVNEGVVVEVGVGGVDAGDFFGLAGA